MTQLKSKQIRFASLVSMLIKRAEDFGYIVTLGEAYRPGDKRCHGMRLAIDLNLFKDGKYLNDTKYPIPYIKCVRAREQKTINAGG